MNYNILNEYIRLLINESSISLSKLDESVIIFLLKESHSTSSISIINKKQFELEILSKFKNPKIFAAPKLDKIILGFIKFSKIVIPNIENVNEVYFSAATKGYGPLMYDLAMSYSDYLVSDRKSVSEQAKNIWKYYFHNRLDVEHVKISNSYLYDEELNYTYKLNDKLDVSNIESKTNEYLYEISNKI